MIDETLIKITYVLLGNPEKTISEIAFDWDCILRQPSEDFLKNKWAFHSRICETSSLSKSKKGYINPEFQDT